MDERKITGLLGMAARAGKAVSGDFAVEKAIFSGRATAVILAKDASDRTRDAVLQKCAERSIPVYDILDKEKLGRCLGKGTRAVSALLDTGFTKALEKELRG